MLTAVERNFIDSQDVFFAILTPRTIKDPWYNECIGYAMEKKKPLYVMQYSEMKLPEGIFVGGVVKSTYLFSDFGRIFSMESCLELLVKKSFQDGFTHVNREHPAVGHEITILFENYNDQLMSQNENASILAMSAKEVNDYLAETGVGNLSAFVDLDSNYYSFLKGYHVLENDFEGVDELLDHMEFKSVELLYRNRFDIGMYTESVAYRVTLPNGICTTLKFDMTVPDDKGVVHIIAGSAAEDADVAYETFRRLDGTIKKLGSFKKVCPDPTMLEKSLSESAIFSHIYGISRQ